MNCDYKHLIMMNDKVQYYRKTLN